MFDYQRPIGTTSVYHDNEAFKYALFSKFAIDITRSEEIINERQITTPSIIKSADIIYDKTTVEMKCFSGKNCAELNKNITKEVTNKGPSDPTGVYGQTFSPCMR